MPRHYEMHAGWMGVLFCTNRSRNEVNERGGMERSHGEIWGGENQVVGWTSAANESAAGGAREDTEQFLGAGVGK